MLTIGRVAQKVGVPPSALRYYEAQGILRPAARRPNGYRIYTGDSIKLLLFVKRAQALGITLKEVKPLLDLAAQGQRPCNYLKQLARGHLREINQKIQELEALRQELRALLRRRAVRAQGNEDWPIIERAKR